jgi:Flp pilus assembly protein TadD
MTGALEKLRRGSIPLLVGALLGFIGGYFAAGGARPNAAATAAPARAAGQDRVAEIQGALEKDPESPKLLTALGNAFYDREDWDGAIRAYEKARRKAAGDPNLLPTWGARNRGEFARHRPFEKARAADRTTGSRS